MLVLCKVYFLKIRFVYLLTFFTFGFQIVQAQEFIFTANCQKAYQSFLSMKMDEGKAHLKKEILQNPKNILPFVLINYEDFVSLSFNENMAVYKQQKPLFEKRLQLIETGSKSSPYYLFSKGLLHFQWCVIRIKHGDYWDAAWD